MLQRHCNMLCDQARESTANAVPSVSATERMCYTVSTSMCRRIGVVGADVTSPRRPENLVEDRAYDREPLDEELRRDGIEMIAPQGLSPKMDVG
jgi:hypothetical protein